MVDQQTPKLADILRQGVPHWNEWRRQNPTVWPDLRRAQLAGSNLAKAELRNANLLEADLEGCNLEQAKLHNVNLKGAKLFAARLRAADLSEANLYEADLREADLGSADLTYANLTKARLDGARLEFATLGYTTIGQTSLAGALGLDRVFHRHELPSSIDVSTLERTASNAERIPRRYLEVIEFYRSLGVPEHLIKHYSWRYGRGVGQPSCFISYSHKDDEFADLLYQRLLRDGVRCYRDLEHMPPGSPMVEEVAARIIAHEQTLVLCSEHSLRSDWVTLEIQYTLEKEQRTKVPSLIPLDLDGCLFDTELDHPYLGQIRSRLAARFIGWRSDLRKAKKKIERVSVALQRPDLDALFARLPGTDVSGGRNRS